MAGKLRKIHVMLKNLAPLWLTCLLVVGCVSSRRPASSDPCPPALSPFYRVGVDDAASISGLAPVHQLELPSESLSWIRAHPLWRLRQGLNEGEGLYFNIQHRPRSTFGSLNNGNFGESNQAAFLEQVLRYVFPKAQFGDEIDPREANEMFDLLKIRSVFLSPGDFAEPGSMGTPGFWPIDMRLLKPANPKVLSLPTKQEIRKQLGLGPDSKILSLYLHNENLVNEADLPRIFQEASLVARAEEALGSIDVVFISMPYRSSNEAFQLPTRFNSKGLLLSELKPGALASGEARWIYNDTSGLLPYLHRAADLVIVRGPINFHEAVNTGTPTLVFDHPAVLGRYERSAWDELVKIGTGSGRSAAVFDPSEISAAFAKVAASPDRGPTMTQPLPGDPSQTSFSRLLNKLQEIIQSRMQKFKATSPSP